MENIQTQIGTSNQNSTVENEGDFMCISEVSSIAPAGKQPGTLVDLQMDNTPGDDGVKVKKLILTGQLQAVDDDKKPFTVTKTFNLLGHGEAAFMKVCGTVMGKKVTPLDLKKFNKKQIIGKSVLFEIHHKKNGKKLIAEVGEILAPTTMS